MESKNVQGSMNPSDTSVRKEFDGYASDDSWNEYRPETELGL